MITAPLFGAVWHFFAFSEIMFGIFKGKQMLSIKEGWQSYRNAVVPKNAHESQLHETETAFYAGAHFLQEVLKYIASLDDKLAEREILKLVDNIESELKEFVVRQIQ